MSNKKGVFLTVDPNTTPRDPLKGSLSWRVNDDGSIVVFPLEKVAGISKKGGFWILSTLNSEIPEIPKQPTILIRDAAGEREVPDFSSELECSNRMPTEEEEKSMDVPKLLPFKLPGEYYMVSAKVDGTPKRIVVAGKLEDGIVILGDGYEAKWKGEKILKSWKTDCILKKPPIFSSQE